MAGKQNTDKGVIRKVFAGKRKYRFRFEKRKIV